MLQKHEESNLLWIKCLHCGFGASIGSYKFMAKQYNTEENECPLCGFFEIAHVNYNPLEATQ